MKLLLIVNGKKAGAPEVRDAVARVRNAGNDVEVRVTWEFGDGLRYTREAASRNVDRVVAGGGDGTVNEVSQGLMRLCPEERPSLAILPLGTANDFARACTIPLDPLGALRLAAGGKARPVDLARANDRYFINVGSAGFGAAVTADTPVELKNFLGGGAYTLMGVLKALTFVPYPIDIRMPGVSLTGDAVIGAACNGRQAGGGQVLAPRAMIDDGLLDVVILLHFPLSRFDQIRTEMGQASGDGEYVRRFRTPWLESSRRQPIPLNLDGEPYNPDRLRIESVPSAIRLVVPPGCPCVGGRNG